MISRTHILASAVVLLFSVASTCLLANRFSLRISPPRWGLFCPALPEIAWSFVD